MAGVTKGFPPPDNSEDILSSSTWSLPQIEQYYAQYPGAAPGGSGETGLAPNDAQGWSALQNLQTRYQILKSGSAPTITLGPLKQAAADPENQTTYDPMLGSYVTPSLLALRKYAFGNSFGDPNARQS